MKHLIGLLTAIVFIALTVLSGRYVSNAEDWAAVGLSIALLLLAQTSLWAGGELAPPVSGKLGVWRGLAVTVFLLQAITLPLSLIQIAWRGLMTGFQLAWAISGGLTALVFILLAKRRWALWASIRPGA